MSNKAVLFEGVDRAWLAFAGVGLAAGYFLLLAISLFRGIWLTPSLVNDRWPFITDLARALLPDSWIDADRFEQFGLVGPLLLGLLLLFLFAIYAAVLIRLRRQCAARGVELRDILLFALMFSVPLWLMPGLLSGDVFSYIFYGKMMAVYQANPMVAIPSDFSTDHFLQRVTWQDVQSVYGPAWLFVSAGLSWLSGDDVVTHVLAFKGLAIVLHLVNVGLVWLILGRIRPTSQVFGTVFYAWNPLALIEFAGSGHNDVMMLTFLLLTVFSYVSGSERLGWLWLGLAVITKVLAAIFVPAYAILLITERPTWRERLSLAAEGSVILSAIGLLGYTPFWVGPQSITYSFVQPPFRFSTNSLGELASTQLQHLLARWPDVAGPWRNELADRIVKVPTNVAFLIYLAIRTLPVRSVCAAAGAWTAGLLFYLTVAAGWYGPWYAVALVALVTLTCDRRLFFPVAVFSFSTSLNYLFTPPPLHPALEQVEPYRSLLTVGPVILVVAAQALWDARRRVEKGYSPRSRSLVGLRVPVLFERGREMSRH